jgi:hypothetical protein
MLTLDTQKCLNVVHEHRQQIINIIGMLETKWQEKTASKTREEEGEPPPVGLADLLARRLAPVPAEP